MSEQRCVSLLKECRSLNCLLQIHGYAIKVGFDTDPFILSKLLLFSAVTFSGAMDYARLLFQNVPQPDGFMFNTLIRGFSESNMPQQSISTYVQMQKQETTLITAYASCGSIECAREVFEEMRAPNLVSYNAMLSAYLRCSEIDEARRIFDQMPWLNVTSWNIMLSGYIDANEFELASRLFDDIPQKDLVSWNTIIIGCVQSGKLKPALELFEELRLKGFRPNEVSITGVLSACSQMGALEFGRMIHGYIDKAGFSDIVAVNNALIDLYGKCGNVKMASYVFHMTMNKTIISWTVMIEVLAMHGHGVEAVDIFYEMIESGVEPDGVTFVAILYACSHAGLTRKGIELFNMMKDCYHIEASMEHYGCMVDLYGRAGFVDCAYEFITRMLIKPNAVIWRTLLGACSIHGDKHNPVAEVAYENLRGMITRLRSQGYVADVRPVLHDIEAEDKEDSVSHHSEKLALAFGMSRMHPESVIRIVKNLRICRDCHAMFKFVSSVYRREIIVRDRSRFHVFKDGSCCCRDYW
ncbi:unnamed protein product [Victoria cruziana]